MYKRVIFIVLISFLVLSSNLLGNDLVIKMGYKTIHKLPLIGDKYDNSGLYLDLFNKAAKKIGYRLEIVRLPKKRLHLALKKGEIDFYPGSSFSLKRVEYLYYLPNGLQTKEVLVSLKDKDTVNRMEDVKGTLIVELGSSKSEWNEIYPNLKIKEFNKLSMNTVEKILKFKRGDFYIADIEIVDFYKRNNNLDTLLDIDLKVHPNAISEVFIPMYLGFSRKSKLFSEKENLNFKEDENISIENYPSSIDKNSIAYQFYLALEELRKENVTNKLYNKYFKTLTLN